MEDKFLVVVKDNLNIVRKQRLCDTYRQAERVQRAWEDSHYDVEIQLLTDSIADLDYKVITLNDNWA